MKRSISLRLPLREVFIHDTFICISRIQIRGIREEHLRDQIEKHVIHQYGVSISSSTLGKENLTHNITGRIIHDVIHLKLRCLRPFSTSRNTSPVGATDLSYTPHSLMHLMDFWIKIF